VKTTLIVQIENLLNQVGTSTKSTRKQRLQRAYGRYRIDANCSRTAMHVVAKGKVTRYLSKDFTAFIKPRPIQPHVIKNERFN